MTASPPTLSSVFVLLLRSSAPRVILLPHCNTRWMYPAALHHITRFAIISHSNGPLYGLYTLLHLRPTLIATPWMLIGPSMPPNSDGFAVFCLASSSSCRWAPCPHALNSLL
ncbi:hypothetical protein B0H19DRAFT_1193625 [Mycena capillaripes]|nr:hypothetical protein B0H19DRAFT_1193625 [Mycena capillaripes]